MDNRHGNIYSNNNDYVIFKMKNKIKQILKKFEEIEEVWSTLSPIERDKSDSLFNEEYSLSYCLRWGMNSCDEILKNFVAINSGKEKVGMGDI